MILTLASVLALLQGTPTVKSYDLAVNPNRRLIMLKQISPVSPAYGEEVTVTGSGLDLVRAVIVGDFAPAILSQEETKLVFRAPYVRGRSEYEARLFLVSPGLPIAAWGSQVVFSQKRRAPPKVSKLTVETLVDEEVRLKPRGTKRYELDGAEAESFSLQLDATGGEVEVSLEPLEPALEPKLRVTYGGGLQWQMGARELLGRAGPMPARVVLTLVGDSAKEVVARLKVTRALKKD